MVLPRNENLSLPECSPSEQASMLAGEDETLFEVLEHIARYKPGILPYLVQRGIVDETLRREFYDVCNADRGVFIAHVKGLPPQ